MTDSSRAPVISVGNLAMGGRGKTPTTAHIASLLVAAGERPAIISRGYRRQQPDDGAVIVSDGTRQLADVARGGDEPVMMARRVPGAAVVVSDVRAIAAALAESALGASVHVLDDGFQHQSLERHLDLVIVTPQDLEDRALPFGRLRSPVRSLRRASAVIVDGADAASVEARIGAIAGPGRLPVFTLVRRSGMPWWLERPVGAGGQAPVPPGASVLAVAGIARPERFTRLLEAAGFRVAGAVSYRDHHPFSHGDVARLRARLTELAASLVMTTEKDAMRLMPLRPLRMPTAVLPLEVSVEPAPLFRAWLIERLREVRAWRR